MANVGPIGKRLIPVVGIVGWTLKSGQPVNYLGNTALL